MLDEILTLKNCQECKKCCKFEYDELLDAPTFKEKDKNYIIQYIDKSIVFSKKWSIFQIILNKIPWKKKFVCPLLDENKWCVLWKKRPFDCQTWPFYIMRLWKNIVVTLSPSCPIINDMTVNRLRKYVKDTIRPYMIKIVSKSKDLITDYHDNATIIEVLGEEKDLFL